MTEDWQYIVIWALLISAITGIIGYCCYRGFNEAAANRHKDEHIYEMCLAKGQPILECRAAIGSGGNG